jgi:hypothetical protein
VEVVQLEALDERAVEQHGRGRGGGSAGADDDRVTAALQLEHGRGGEA